MKKIILAAIVAAAMTPALAAQEYVDSVALENENLQQRLRQLEDRQAQNDSELSALKAEKADRDAREIDKRTFGPGRFTKICYNWGSTGDGFNPVDKSKFSVSLSKGASYLFPANHAWGGMVKVGFDITWFDITYTKYKSNFASATDGWTSDFDNDIPNYNDYDGDDWSDYDPNLGRMSVMIGALGVGPRVSVAPFAWVNNGLRYLRASLYFHYQPTATGYLVDEDGNLEASFAYMGMLRFGGCLQYRRIGIGVEGYWGKAKFKTLGLDFGDDEEVDSPKIERKFAMTRLYLNFAF